MSFFLLFLSVLSLIFSIKPVILKEGIVYDIGVSRVFYVHVPPSDNFRDLIIAIGLYDNTHVSIYDITDSEAATLVSEGMVNKKESFYFKAAPRKYYKIIADKPIAAWLVGGAAHNWPDNNYAGCGGSTFYPSVEGSYVGREFIFMAGGTYNANTAWLGIDIFTPISPAPFETKCYGIEHASVSVYDASGNLLYQFDIGPGMCVNFPTICMEIYHVISTGDIMLQCAGGGNCFTIAPSINGNLVGKVHYGSTFAWQRGCFLVVAYEPCHVKVYDVDTGELLYEHTFTSAGECWYRGGLGIVTVRPTISLEKALELAAKANNVGTRNLKFESTGNIMVYVGDTETIPYEDDSPAGIGDDIAFVGGIEAREFYVYAPTYLVIFAPSDANILINGTSYSLRADHHLTLKGPSLYYILSDQPIIIEVVGQGTGAAATVNDYASYLLSFPNIPIVSPKTSARSPFDIMYIIIIFVVVAICMVSILILILKKGVLKKFDVLKD